MSGESLRAAERLKGRLAIRRVLTDGHFVEDRLLVLRYLKRDGALGRRIAVGTARRFGGAVARNRMRRQLRYLYRKHRDLLPLTGDFFLIARSAAAEATYPELAGSFQRLVDALRH